MVLRELCHPVLWPWFPITFSLYVQYCDEHLLPADQFNIRLCTIGYTKWEASQQHDPVRCPTHVPVPEL